MSLLKHRQVILAKIESSYNVDPTPTATSDAIQVMEPSVAPEGLRMVEHNVVKPSLGPKQSIYAGHLATITFDVEIKGAGATYSASVRPELDVLLRACGMAATVDTSTGTENITYAPASSSLESITIYRYIDGKRQILTGCRGNVSFNFETGNIGIASFTLTGHIATDTDTTLATPTVDTTKPPAIIGGAFTIDSYSAIINALAFDLGNELAMPPSLSASDGFAEVQITNRKLTGSFDPERVLVATEAFDANLRSGASMALATGTFGGTQFNRFSVTMPAVTYTGIGEGDRDGIATYELEFEAVESSTDDQVTLTFN